MHSSAAISSLLFALSLAHAAVAFTTTGSTSNSVVNRPFSSHHQQRIGRSFHLFSSSTDLEDEIKSMRVGEIKQELESLGVSTRTFLEKSELVEALVKARKEGKKPISSGSSSSTVSSSSTESTATTSTTKSTTTAAPTNPEERKQRIKEEMEKCNTMKTGELKSELESLGVSTKSFFEKSEFIRALAEARVDGVTVKKSKKKKRRVASDDDEVEEVTAKVEVITNDNVGPKTKKSRDNSQGTGGNPFGGAGGSPFGGMPFGGGAGGGPGGMDMNNIADMLKNMGGAGGAGSAGGNPFAGGANPFGGGAGMADAMKAAQAAMNNPKVKKVIEKAQKNPKVMQAVQECMGNPSAMSKYMTDPEVGPILRELQQAMM